MYSRENSDYSDESKYVANILSSMASASAASTTVSKYLFSQNYICLNLGFPVFQSCFHDVLISYGRQFLYPVKICQTMEKDILGQVAHAHG